MEAVDVQAIVRQAIQEFVTEEHAKNEPAYKAELQDERKRREQLERRLNELVEENKRSRQVAEEAERGAAIRGELQRLGVAKVDLAFKTVADVVSRAEDGRLVAKGENGEVSLRDYLTGFVNENPEFLPARIAGGTGMTVSQKAGPTLPERIEMERIRPGLDPEEMQKIREEIARVAAQAMKGM
jgi:murein L,D-transpeptidase YcbB/YkuD